MRTVLIFLTLLSVAACQAHVGGDDDAAGDDDILLPLPENPDGFTAEPKDAPVALPVGTTITISQLHSIADDADGPVEPPPELLGGRDEEQILVTVRTDNPTAFPGSEKKPADGLHLYVNGMPIPLESSSPAENPTTWTFRVEEDDIPIRLVPSNWTQWELRAWRFPPPDAPPDGGPEGGIEEFDAAAPDGGGGGGDGPYEEFLVWFRMAEQLPPGFPNFLTPAAGEAIPDAGSYTMTWTPLGLEAWVGQEVMLQIQGWIQGGALDLRPDPDVPIPVAESRGTLTFNVGSFADWDWINQSLVVPMAVSDPFRVVGARRVNQ